MKTCPNIRRLTVFNICYNFRLYSVLAVIYFAQVTHAYALALSIFSVAQISQAVCEVPFGYYSDKFGRANCLRVGAAASLFSIVLYAIGQNYAILILGAVCEGITRAAFSGNNDALLYETLQEAGRQNEYHHEFSRVNSWMELSGFVGVVLGGVIAIKSLPILFSLSIFPQLAAVLISLSFIEPQVKKDHFDSVALHFQDSLSAYKTNFKIRLLSLGDIIGSVGGVTWSFQSAFYNLFLPTWATDLVMSINFLTSFISFRLSGNLIRRFEAIKVLLYSEVYCRVLIVLAYSFPSIASPFLIATASISYGPSVVAKSTILQEEFTNEQRATMASINALIGNIAYSISAVLVGLAADKYGVSRSLFVIQVILISISLIYFRLYKLFNRELNE